MSEVKLLPEYGRTTNSISMAQELLLPLFLHQNQQNQVRTFT